MGVVLYIFMSVCAAYFVKWYTRRYKVINYLRKFHGPTPLPILGNSMELLSKTEFLSTLQKLTREYGDIVKLWIGPIPSMLIIQDCQLVEFILTSTKMLKKSAEYSYLKDWLGDGLLTNNGDARWFKHRKILNPAFYYNVLERYFPVLSSVADVLVNKLKEEIGNPSFDVASILKLYTLDNTCECAMGTAVNALERSDSEFVHSVSRACDILIQRTFNPFLQPEILFRFTKQYREQQMCFKLLKSTVDLVIQKRKAKIQHIEIDTDIEDCDVDIGKKRRLAFLDLLLNEAAKDSTLSDEQIREEVATFLFAGHETTQVAMSFCLYSLAENQDIQEKLVEELRNIFSDEKERPITINDLNGMKYMEAVIKETLRLYPPVPLYARRTDEDLEYDGGVIPKDVTLIIFAFGMHRNADLYPNPLNFDPERFVSGNLPKSPYAYIPFSAGPRDCIGKKFAMMEMKLTMAMLLRKFEFFPASPRHVPILIDETVLASQNGVCLHIESRNF